MNVKIIVLFAVVILQLFAFKYGDAKSTRRDESDEENGAKDEYYPEERQLEKRGQSCTIDGGSKLPIHIRLKTTSFRYWWFSYDVIKNMIMQIMINYIFPKS